MSKSARMMLLLLVGCSAPTAPGNTAGTVDSGVSIDAGPMNACLAAGGACIAESADSCINGTVGAAAIYSCGDGTGLECCFGGYDAGLAEPDGGFDAGPGPQDAGGDAGPTGTTDAGPASTDAGPDAGPGLQDAGGTTCGSAGGQCVAAGTCTSGDVGDPNLDVCAVGDDCCLPAADAGQDAGLINCAAAGGQCVIALADACPAGVVGPANQYSCGGGVGDECCLPLVQDAGPTNCAAAGGQCVGVVPGACATGTVGDSTVYSCGPGIGDECCLPGTDGG